MNPDALLRRSITTAKYARRSLQCGNLQAAVNLVEAIQKDLKDAVWLLERQITHREMEAEAARQPRSGERL